MIDIVNRLRFDAVRCEATFSRGVAGNIEEAADEIERLRMENDRFRKTLEIITGSSDKLQATQALGALSNIGAAVR